MRILVLCIALAGLMACEKKLPNGEPYPDIKDFQNTPTDQFLVDIQDIDDGHPFIGATANAPHKGAHVHFDNSDSSYNNSMSPNQYPPIYAVSAGEITRVETYYELQNPQQTHYKYDIELMIAKGGTKPVSISYSIEPMINPGDPDFYKPFIHVSVGDMVEKGQVIANMYLKEGYGIGAHIHFHINKDNQHMAPAIFSDALVDSFHSRWNIFALDKDYSTGIHDSIPACMGYKVGADENPFETGYQDRL